MKNALILTENQTHFLQENRQDPITGDSFFFGDEIIFCAECKSAFLKESWEYMDRKHCNQNKTLKNFPVSFYLILNKTIISNFEQADKHARIFAYLVDGIIGILLGVFIAFLMNYFVSSQKNFSYGLGVLIGYMIFKDALLKNKSIGKYLLGVQFINKKENKEDVFIACAYRNIIYWSVSAIITYILFGRFIASTVDELICKFYFVCILHFVYFLMMLLKNSLFDRILGIKLVQEKNKYNQ
jgi:hypothetical protein